MRSSIRIGHPSLRSPCPQSASSFSTNVNCIPKTGQAVSKLGFGAYRISRDNPVHVSALRSAVLQSGISVLDTAAHFGDGSSEMAIGDLLSSVNGPNRKDLFIITKAGFITPGVVQVLNKANVSPSLIYRIGQSDVAHSISPLVVRAQLDESLKRLQINYIDLYMINCPERLLLTWSANQLELSLAHTIEYLVSECHAGRIKGFGFTSTKEEWALPTKIISSVLNDSGDLRFWQGVQVPANIYEKSFLKTDFLDQVIDQRLALFTHRLITAITPHGVQKLSTSTDSFYASLPVDEDGDIHTAKLTDLIQEDLQTLSTLEEELIDQVDDTSLCNRFVWASTLGETIDKLVKNEMAARFFFDHKVLPQVTSDTFELAAAANPAAKPHVQNWIDQYLETLKSAKVHICALAHCAAVASHRGTRDLLAMYTPGWVSRNAELPEMLLALMYGARAHVPGAVLVGMRQSQYVSQLSRVAGVPRDVYLRVRDSGVLEHLFHKPATP